MSDTDIDADTDTDTDTDSVLSWLVYAAAMASACRQMTLYVMARLLLYDNDSHTFIAVIGMFTAV